MWRWEQREWSERRIKTIVSSHTSSCLSDTTSTPLSVYSITFLSHSNSLYFLWCVCVCVCGVDFGFGLMCAVGYKRQVKRSLNLFVLPRKGSSVLHPIMKEKAPTTLKIVTLLHRHRYWAHKNKLWLLSWLTPIWPELKLPTKIHFS
jgi:hypothetical protein